eukprot:844080-Prymnesium_polylepis.1
MHVVDEKIPLFEFGALRSPLTRGGLGCEFDPKCDERRTAHAARSLRRRARALSGNNRVAELVRTADVAGVACYRAAGHPAAHYVMEWKD